MTGLTVQVPKGLSVASASAEKTRVPRYPVHDFHGRTLPYQIQPIMIAPVLAGETMKNLTTQMRVVTNPVRNRLIGWWNDTYYFYVKLRDLKGIPEQDIKDMLMDLGYDIKTDHSTAAAPVYYHNSGVNWLKYCLDQIVLHYFRSGDDPVSIAELGGLPLAAVKNRRGVDDSLIATASIEDEVIDQTPTADISMNALSTLEQTWLLMKNAQLTDMTFEDYIEQFGVRQKKGDELGEPELIRVMSEWAYPTNTIADDGSASSAVSWTIAGRADKDRMFKEPGFLVGVNVSRPKVYFGNQKGYAAHLLDNALAWLPATLKEQVWSSLKDVPQATGIYSGIYPSAGYTLDVRDLFVYGDQMLFNSTDATAATDINIHSLPLATSGKDKYPSQADIDNLFVGASGGTIEVEGTTRMTILGTQLDHT